MLNRRLCALALVLTAAIHLAVVPEHLREWPLAAGFFVVLAVVEMALAVGVVRHPHRPTFIAGVLVSVASVALWVVSRSVGLPAGPEAFVPEAALAPDVASATLELLSALLFFQLARRTTTPTLSPIHQ